MPTIATDPYSQFTGAPDQPAIGGFAVTPSDANELPQITTRLYVSGAGTLALVMLDGSAVSLTATAGAILPLRVRKVSATGTTATGIVGLY